MERGGVANLSPECLRISHPSKSRVTECFRVLRLCLSPAAAVLTPPHLARGFSGPLPQGSAAIFINLIRCMGFWFLGAPSPLVRGSPIPVPPPHQPPEPQRKPDARRSARIPAPGCYWLLPWHQLVFPRRHWPKRLHPASRILPRSLAVVSPSARSGSATWPGRDRALSLRNTPFSRAAETPGDLDTPGLGCRPSREEEGGPGLTASPDASKRASSPGRRAEARPAAPCQYGLKRRTGAEGKLSLDEEGI